jgi:hypothetical protein
MNARLLLAILLTGIFFEVNSSDDCLPSIQVKVRGTGPGYQTTAVDPPQPSLPDFVTTKVWLTTPWQTETYRYGQPETMKMHAQFENIGDGGCSGTIEIHFYLSKGYKEDPHTEWKRVGTDIVQCDNLKPGMTHSEEEGIELWRDIPEPGIWNITAYIDHTQDDHNEGGAHPEKHESNNGSTEAVFEVTADGAIVNPDPRFVDFTSSSLQFLGSIPSYAGDPARLGAWIINQGNVAPSTGIRSSYSVECPGTGRIFLTDDGTDASELGPGMSAWEETLTPVYLPNVSGNCTAYFCPDYQGAVSESNEGNNCVSLSFTLQPRPKPKLVITQFRDQRGCCTTNTGEYIYPDIWIRNDGQAAPGANILVLYQVSSPIGTGGAYWNIGYGTITPNELPPGSTDEDSMDAGRWQIPKLSAWKKQWHTVRACVHPQGATPTGGSGDVCVAYTRYSKK